MKTVLRGLLLLATLPLPSCKGDGVVTPGQKVNVPWQVAALGSETTPAVSVSDSLLIGITGDGDVLAMRLSDGAIRWRKRFGAGGHGGENVAIVSGVAALSGAGIIGVRTATGQELWRWQAPNAHDNIASDATSFVVAESDGRVTRLVAETGIPLWTHHLTVNDSLRAFGPSIIDGRVYVCGNWYGSQPLHGSLFALSAADGRLLWRYDYTPELPYQFSVCFGRVVVAGGVVVSAQSDGRIFGHDPETGAVRWISPRLLRTIAEGGPDGSLDLRYVARNANWLVATSDARNGSIALLDSLTGAVRWRGGIIGSSSDAPVVGATYIALNHSGVLGVYRAADGGLVAIHPPTGSPNRVGGSPVIHNDVLYFVAADGFYARRLPW